jgi:hypothetical protein
MGDMQCMRVEGAYGLLFGVGTCTDTKDNKYLEFSAGIGPIMGGGLFVNDEISSSAEGRGGGATAGFELSAQAAMGPGYSAAVGAGHRGVSARHGPGIGVMGGAALKARFLVPLK